MYKRQRGWRLWVGGVSIVAGATLTTLAAVRTFAVARTPAHTVLDVSMLATGAGLLGTGVSGVVLKSEMERAYARQGARRTRLRAGVGAGTVSLSGRF
ncbi:MAG: hypothetical protein KUG77_17070 [Nannocystaceae bacterium]|nr:hypothetical protein [Nannocystaceae bacterium]